MIEAPHAVSTPLIDVTGATKRFGPKVVLEDVDVRLLRGEVVGLVGPNGAGKSTLIRMLCGLSRPDSGSGEVLGLPFARRDGRVPFIGLMAERPTFIESMGAERNLGLLGGIRGRVTADQIRQTIIDVGLEHAGKKPVRSYSLGMRQRLSLAQAIMEEPDLVILDEPTNGLDPDGIVEMRSIIRKLADERGMGVLLASHLLREVEAVCDRVILLRGGRIRRTIDRAAAADGTYVLQLAMPADAAAVGSMAGMTVIDTVDAMTRRVVLHGEPAQALRELVIAGVAVTQFYREDSHLERAYLEVMEEAS